MCHDPICQCSERISSDIGSIALLKEIEAFFAEQLTKGIYIELTPDKPYYSYQNRRWYADKWYKCTACGCLWEIVYPDFPAKGFVRNLEWGKYIEKD